MSERIFLSICGLFLLGLALPAEGQLTLARNGKALMAIILQPEATVTERYAAEELASHLEKICGAKFEIREISPGEVPKEGIIIGP
ncbi:MAG: hypothetical protein ACPLSK_02445, partial [bacterium]